MSENGSFTDTGLTHYNDRNIESNSLNYEAHLKEVIDINNISFFTIDPIIIVS